MMLLSLIEEWHHVLSQDFHHVVQALTRIEPHLQQGTI